MSRLGASFGVAVTLGLAVALSCSPERLNAPPSTMLHRPPVPTAAEPLASAPLAVASSEPEPHAWGTPLVALLEPGVLSQLQQAGFSLGTLVLGSASSSAKALGVAPRLRGVWQTLRADLAATRRMHPIAKVTSIDGFRLFDEKWLASEAMSFELIGIFNRLDRRVFYQGTCGEVRFVYRLRYAVEQGGESMSFRLPLTINLVYLVPGSSCDAFARSWLLPEGAGGDLSPWLTHEGPLRESARSSWQLKSLETNLQSFRLQSSVQTSLAGHIEYRMRVFHPLGADGQFEPGPMENMPDVPRLQRDATLRQELLALLKQPATLAAINQGTLQLPQQFLATDAMSVSPRSLTRGANRPFRSLFSAEQFSDLDLSGFATLRSPAALLRRLDGLTCTGCHQSRSIAGFHHVGDEDEQVPSYAALLSGSSSHLQADLERRRDYLLKAARGEATAELRPPAELQGAGQGFGAPCGLGDPGFADWTCAEGLRCARAEDPDVGVCLDDSTLGGPCEVGDRVVPHQRSHREQVSGLKRLSCDAGQGCDTNLSGFPLGSCRTHCDTKDSAGTCSEFLDVDGFQNCLRARLPATACAEKHVFTTGLRVCDAARPCRQDYVCARSTTQGVGACMPPYFVYPLRLDGYPLRR